LVALIVMFRLMVCPSATVLVSGAIVTIGTCPPLWHPKQPCAAMPSGRAATGRAHTKINKPMTGASHNFIKTSGV
jgi:hypothetical protein